MLASCRAHKQLSQPSVHDASIAVRSIRVKQAAMRRAQDLQTALGFAAQLLPLYESWFGVAYPLRKLDLVAIPDFAAGAMENWGLITFRETALLVSSLSGVAGVRSVASVVAHEMAHLVRLLFTCGRSHGQLRPHHVLQGQHSEWRSMAFIVALAHGPPDVHSCRMSGGQLDPLRPAAHVSALEAPDGGS